MTLPYDKQKLARMARKHGLSFVILHGSYATGRAKPDSDLDIAVVAKKEPEHKKILALYDDFGKIFGNNRNRELDLKALNHTDPLFRYEVVRDGKLLFGNETEYEVFKASVRLAYDDAQPLRDLERKLIEKFQRHLTARATA